MKIESLVFLKNCWLIIYFESGFWQYSVLCKDGSFYTPDIGYLTANQADRAGIMTIQESMAEDSRS